MKNLSHLGLTVALLGSLAVPAMAQGGAPAAAGTRAVGQAATGPAVTQAQGATSVARIGTAATPAKPVVGAPIAGTPATQAKPMGAQGTVAATPASPVRVH